MADVFAALPGVGHVQVKALHPAHTAASIRALLPRLRYYDNGTCIVHHIFGGEVRASLTAGSCIALPAPALPPSGADRRARLVLPLRIPAGV